MKRKGIGACMEQWNNENMCQKEKEEAVKLVNVTKTFSGFSLKDINLTLPKGYIHGLVGANGVGKTTLLHLLMGFYSPDEGEIEVLGGNFKEEEKRIKEEIGVVLQERLFENYLTLEENASYYGKYYANYDEAYFRELMERLHLRLEQKYKNLSKGEELKFQFAFTLAHKPKLLLLDEPTGNFDPEFREEFLKILKEFVGDGERSVILATHLTEDLDRIADYIIYLENGRLLLCMEIEELRDRYRIAVGEDYKINLLPKEAVIYSEKGAYGTKALLRHRRRYRYDNSVTIMSPTIEEFMYFITKRKKGVEID